MKRKPLKSEIAKISKSISNKRARIVIKHILKHGYVTTEELEKTYGYKHPPRAVRDVREAGIPLETFAVKSSDGRSIAGYRFGDPTKIQHGRLQGRSTFPKSFKARLYILRGGKCAICSGKFEARYLQVDHRVPYEVAGDPQVELRVEDFRFLCGPCNRAKSWSCEHCTNWQSGKLANICLTCYWASPDNYMHIALREIRRLDVLWNEDEIKSYELLKLAATRNDQAIPEYVKKIINSYLHRPDK